MRRTVQWFPWSLRLRGPFVASVTLVAALTTASAVHTADPAAARPVSADAPVPDSGVPREALTDILGDHLATFDDYERWLDALTETFDRQTSALRADIEAEEKRGGSGAAVRAALRDMGVGVARSATAVRRQTSRALGEDWHLGTELGNVEGVLALLLADASAAPARMLAIADGAAAARRTLTDIELVRQAHRASQRRLVPDLLAAVERAQAAAAAREAAVVEQRAVTPGMTWSLALGMALAAAALAARWRRGRGQAPTVEVRDPEMAATAGDHASQPAAVVPIGSRESLGRADRFEASVGANVITRAEHERIVSTLVASHEGALRDERAAAAAELAAGVAADLDEHLMSAVGHAQIARRRSGSASIDQDLSALIDRLTEVGRVMRSLANVQARAAMSAVRLDLIAAEVADLVRAHAAPELAVSVRVGDGDHTVTANAVRLRHAVLQLASNARRAMPAGGQLTIEVGSPRVAASDGAASGTAVTGSVLRVKDTGRGIPAEMVERIFEPFVTTAAEADGAGLGLAQVAGVMARLGGGVRVESEEGLGTTVTLLFPHPSQVADRAVPDEAPSVLAIAS